MPNTSHLQLLLLANLPDTIIHDDKYRCLIKPYNYDMFKCKEGMGWWCKIQVSVRDHAIMYKIKIGA